MTCLSVAASGCSLFGSFGSITPTLQRSGCKRRTTRATLSPTLPCGWWKSDRCKSYSHQRTGAPFHGRNIHDQRRAHRLRELLHLDEPVVGELAQRLIGRWHALTEGQGEVPLLTGLPEPEVDCRTGEIVHV